MKFRAVRNIISYYLSGFAAKALFFIQSIFLARYLGPSGYGLYGIIFTAIGFFYILISKSIDDITVRELSSRSSSVSPFFQANIRFKLKLLLPSVLIGLVAATILKSITLPILLFTCIIIVEELLLSSCFAILRSRNLMIFDAIANYLRAGITVLVVSSALLIRSSIVVVLAGFAVGNLIAVVYVLLVLKRKLQFRLFASQQQNRLHISSGVAIMTLAVFANSLIYKTDAFMIAGFLSLREVGIYEIAFAVMGNLVFLGGVISKVMLPQLSKQTITRTTRSLFRRTALFSAIIGSFILLLFLSFGKQILSILYGPAYHASYIPLIFFGGSLIFIFLNSLYSALLIARNFLVQNTVHIIIGFCINVVLNLVFIPHFGITGAAFTSLLSFASVFIMHLLYVRRHRILFVKPTEKG